jgi:hypothetical protein
MAWVQPKELNHSGHVFLLPSLKPTAGYEKNFYPSLGSLNSVDGVGSSVMTQMGHFELFCDRRNDASKATSSA